MQNLGEQWWESAAEASVERIEPQAPDGELLEEILAAYERSDSGPAYESRTPEEQELVRILRARGQMEAELERAKANSKALIASLAGRVAAFDWKFKQRAESLTRAILERQRGKTVATLFGKAGFRRRPVRVIVVDPAKVPEEFQRVIREPDLGKIKASGECPSGCDVVGGDDSFFMGG